MTVKPTIICLVPVKNEAWTLDRCLQCASIWADHIIVADQSDRDDCRAIATKYPKVTYVKNPSERYSEHERQRLLLGEARKYPEPRVLFSIDADEALSANCLTSREWQTILEQPAGTVFYLQRVEIRPDLETYWMVNELGLPRAFVDDNRSMEGISIHGPLLPVAPNARWVMLRDIKILHYQYAEWMRMESKHRWYLVWEHLVNTPHASTIDTYRTYHHMHAVPPGAIKPLRREWFQAYLDSGIDTTSIVKTQPYWYDCEVLEWLEKHGARRFRRLAIWDVNWAKLAVAAGMEDGAGRFRDPRGLFHRAVHKWLMMTQPNNRSPLVRFGDAVLKKAGW